jgi:hypothetical protein
MSHITKLWKENKELYGFNFEKGSKSNAQEKVSGEEVDKEISRRVKSLFKSGK